jgi:hypothetical protein
MRCIRNALFALFLSTLPIQVLARDSAFPKETEAVPSPYDVSGEIAPRLAGNNKHTVNRSGGTYPAYRAGQSDPAAPAAAPSSRTRGLGQPPRPSTGDPSVRDNLPLYGPPPGWGPTMDRQRQRMGPGYPGLRGPGTGYPQHRQYGNPIRYPAPRGSD